MSNATPQQGLVTLKTIRAMAQAGEPFACLTCYDATTARLLEKAGVPLLLVGDTAAEVILGFTRTIDMPLDVLLALTAAVKRGAPRTVVMGDMPFMSYQADDAEGIRNAGRFLTEGLADIVKVEADSSTAPLVEKMVRAGIPICGHVGSRPQRAAISAGYASAGRTADEARQIVADAIALEQAGCGMLLVEAVPDEVTDAIMRATTAPLIGIGAGTACHGQVLVLQDALGLSQHAPRFVDPVAQLSDHVIAAGREWIRRVQARDLGGHRYTMKPGESTRFEETDGSSGGEDAGASGVSGGSDSGSAGPGAAHAPQIRPAIQVRSTIAETRITDRHA
ncbi:MAG: 3-methyl-2-oxobutanoate hydroxymethyltransferase [Phycisphaerales bacterium]|nr:3-methyl-2-oxobutanoate hydroxymethyltransferase [Phycisphaerales bacterium]